MDDGRRGWLGGMDDEADDDGSGSRDRGGTSKDGGGMEG